MTLYDLVIIGGGINGCGCAADAAMRGLSVMLCEQDDIASKTSSSSSKLIHGGLRYLESFDFKLVSKSLNEQQTLIQIAPHLIHPLAFILANSKNSRSMLWIKLGLYIYDHLSSKNTLPNNHYIKRVKFPKYFKPLRSNIKNGFMYYDCRTDDARLTIVNAIQAKKHGANIQPNSQLIASEVIDGIWNLTIKSKKNGTYKVFAKSVINATGPWIKPIDSILKIKSEIKMSLVKGSHIVTKKLYEGEHAYLLQNTDKRIIFVIPYNGYTMIGTTEQDYNHKVDEIKIDEAEIIYLLKIVNSYFNTNICRDEIISTWSGIRPLLADKNKGVSKLSRDYLLQYANSPAPVISIYGGKITTYRDLSEQAIDKLKCVFKEIERSKTKDMLLPGAEFENMQCASYQKFAKKKYHWLDKQILSHYLATYGTLTENILKSCVNKQDLGKMFSKILYQVEVDYLISEEWATTSEDVLWRRTKLGLQLNTAEQDNLNQYILEHQTLDELC
ncbi:MAG: glycerol-3-phosphate dehydrogenase [Legionellaceae bacterium]|nr:glycerol-3-phosphate dehydrogenase [Legionellaceae bacterium]